MSNVVWYEMRFEALGMTARGATPGMQVRVVNS